MLEALHRDFVLGLRGLRRSPILSLTAVLTLAIGIGANTAVFTLLYGLLLRSLPVAEPQRLARISLVSPTRPLPVPFIPFRLLEQFREQQRAFADIAAWSESRATLADRDGALQWHVAVLVSGNAFEVLGMPPHRGRLLTPSDDVRGGPAHGWPVVLSYSFWRDRFGADPSVIGTALTIADAPVTIVGVTPPSFHGVSPGVEPKMFFPLQFASVLDSRSNLNAPGSLYTVAAIGRLNPDVSVETATAEIAVRERALLDNVIPPALRSQAFFRDARLIVESARTGLPTFFGRTYSEPLLLMQGLVAIMLLLCCVNVGGLMMSKIHERQHEFAVRRAVGAGRSRLVIQYLTESLAIALIGAALGGATAWYGSIFLQGFFRSPMMGVGMSVQPDRTVFLVTAVSAVVTTVLFGSVPAWRASRTDPATLLKSRSAAQRQIAARGFVAIQVALSVALVALATLLSQSLVRLQREDTGFDLDHVTIQTAPFHLLPQAGNAKLDLYQRMVDRIEQAPGGVSAAVTWYTPMTGFQGSGSFQPVGTASEEASTLAYNEVGPGYFRTMKIRIVDGREFEKHERARDVCVLNQAAADHLFPRQSPLGQYVRSSDTNLFKQPIACRVIGVAGDAKFASQREPPPRTVYCPVNAERNYGNLVFLLNAPTKTEAIAAYREALREIAPAVPLVLFATLREQMDAALGSQRAITLLSTFFGAMALLLSAVGLYGMLSSSVTQRTAEIGVRVAIGASRPALLRMVVFDALRLVGAGMIVGALGLIFAVRWIEQMLYGVTAFDPLTMAASAAMLIAVALLASLVPALRAASVDPMQAMRAE